MNNEQKTIHFDTHQHIHEVRRLLAVVQCELILRAVGHDKSKLESPEMEVFAECTPKLAGLTYGTKEYKEALADLGPALAHHYANNRHHPEFHAGEGISGMTLIDLLEMICDWMAAAKRHTDGDIFKSLKINESRFNIHRQLKYILSNTVVALMGQEKHDG